MFFPVVTKAYPDRFFHGRLSGVAAVQWRFKAGVKGESVVAQTVGSMQIVNYDLVDILNYVTLQYGWMSHSSGDTENPRLYKTKTRLVAALLRGQKEFGEFGYCFTNGLPDSRKEAETFFSAACWIHNEHYYKPLDKYVEIEHFFPGCPTQ